MAEQIAIIARLRGRENGKLVLEPLQQSHFNAVPLFNAVLCEDCKNITDSRGNSCVMCGSTAIWRISRLLGELAERKKNVVPSNGK
jgi:hypothetical protein